jgi:uncharacterized protein (TIGR02453 family)
MSQALSPAIFQFLEKLRVNNNRPWFDENKGEYLAVQQEFKSFIASLLPAAEQFYPGAGLLKPENCIYRIYRDVRFSKNKLPYKVNISASIGSQGRKSGFDSIYLHIENNASFLAAGAYELQPEQLAAIRQEIDYNSQALKSVISDPEFVSYFGQIEGNKLKTSPKGFDKEHPDIELLRFTQMYIMHPFSNNEILSADFANKVLDGISRTKPLTGFLLEATAQHS